MRLSYNNHMQLTKSICAILMVLVGLSMMGGGFYYACTTEGHAGYAVGGFLMGVILISGASSFLNIGKFEVEDQE